MQLLIGVLPHGIYRYYHILIFKCIRRAESFFIFGLSFIQPPAKQTAFLLGKRRGWLAFFFFFFWLAFVGDFSFFKSFIKEKEKEG